jgi:hypothetical protein
MSLRTNDEPDARIHEPIRKIGATAKMPARIP